MTPEQKLRQQMEQEIKRILPKGRFLLQPVETNTVGVPDYYLSWVGHQLWIEVKTTAYIVDKFQLNWAIRAHQAGTLAVVLTAIQPHSKAQTLIPIPTHQPLSRAAPQPLKTSSTLQLLAFDSSMLDFSTLGAYINAKRPAMIPLAQALLQPELLSELRPITRVSE